MWKLLLNEGKSGFSMSYAKRLCDELETPYLSLMENNRQQGRVYWLEILIKHCVFPIVCSTLIKL